MSTKQVRVFYDHIITKPPNSSNAYCLEIDFYDYWIPVTISIEKGYISMNEEEKTIEMPEWLCIEKGLENYII